MPKLRLTRLCICVSTLLLLSHCTADSVSSGQGGSANGGATSQGGATSGGGSGGTSSGGATSAGGMTSAGGSTSAGGATSAGGGTGTGGKATGGSTTSAGGSTSPGGSGGGNGGVAGGAGGGAGGTTGTGGTSAAGGATGAGGVRVDSSGIPLAKPGDSTIQSRAYLNLGDMRLINNRWGSDAMGCNGTQLKVYVNTDKTIGWDFTRGSCDSKHGHPDYPEVEFGVAPFGATSPDLTSPPFSSTTLLPLQIKDLTSASVTIDNFNSTYQQAGYFDTNFEFWISKQNPLTAADPGVFAEIIVFLGWDNVRMNKSGGWPCDKSGTVTAGTASYYLCHQSDSWSNGRWRFYNFNLSNGPQNNFSGKADVKALLDWVMKNYSGFTNDMWLTRIEVGTEVDDNTQGSAKISNLTFEVNGTSKSIELAK